MDFTSIDFTSMINSITSEKFIFWGLIIVFLYFIYKWVYKPLRGVLGFLFLILAIYKIGKWFLLFH